MCEGGPPNPMQPIRRPLSSDEGEPDSLGGRLLHRCVQSLLPNQEHRAGGVVHDLVRNTAQQQTLPFGHAARPEDDQVCPGLDRNLDDLLGRVAGAHPANLPSGVDASFLEPRDRLRHEVLRGDRRTEVDIGPLVSLVFANVNDGHHRGVPLSEVEGDGNRLLALW